MGNLQKRVQVLTAARKGVCWLGTENLGREPTAPARTDVVKSSLENSFNSPIFEASFHFLKIALQKLNHSCVLLLGTRQQICEYSNWILLHVFIILVSYRQLFVSFSNSSLSECVSLGLS